jgi:hypothetical protein
MRAADVRLATASIRMTRHLRPCCVLPDPFDRKGNFQLVGIAPETASAERRPNDEQQPRPTWGVILTAFVPRFQVPFCAPGATALSSYFSAFWRSLGGGRAAVTKHLRWRFHRERRSEGSACIIILQVERPG